MKHQTPKTPGPNRQRNVTTERVLQFERERAQSRLLDCIAECAAAASSAEGTGRPAASSAGFASLALLAS